MDISASQTPAGDTLEEKSSESSEHKSTQVGSEKVLSFVSAFLEGTSASQTWVRRRLSKEYYALMVLFL